MFKVAKYLSYKIQLVSQGTTCDRRVGEIAKVGELYVDTDTISDIIQIVPLL